ncbi:hypothetical protein CMUST_05635 [Corynebacterium mustelae]|uniref:DUF3558 family protein n=1 Tax=Corynebacterium mustelae TaxID=571915 RepID=A0A0G3H0W3_9CORY|nr:DUF3558 family protein [Corynebacterium mustelae]AKK05463.1 hypothetical protein CMUST_05635 [Corynebacterium mustelae]
MLGCFLGFWGVVGGFSDLKNWWGFTCLGVAVFFMEPVGVVGESNSIEQVVYLVLHWLSVALKGGFEEMVEKMSMCARTLPDQITARSARCTVSAVVVCCVFLLSGCGLSTPLAQYLAVKNQPQSQQLPASSQVAEPKTLGEVLEAGTGTFDPTDPNLTVFDPCGEVTKEQYEQFGLTIWDVSHTARKDFAVCAVNPIDVSKSDFGFTISTDVVTYEHIESLDLIVDRPLVALPEHWYQHRLSDKDDELDCTIAVSTNRGRISLTASGSNLVHGITPEMSCQEAVDMLQKIFALKG